MVEGIVNGALVTTALALVYAAWWLVRHELAVRRFRVERQDRPGWDEQ